MQLVAYQKMKKKEGVVELVIARDIVMLPQSVPMDSDLGFDDYRQQYLYNAKQRFEQHLKDNGKSNFEIFGFAQSRMNHEDFTTD